MEVTQHALDIFENLAHHILLRGPADFFLAALKRHVYDTDRARIITSVKCLSRLTMVEKNERVMSSIDTALLQRMLQLLLVPDEEIVVVVLVCASVAYSRTTCICLQTARSTLGCVWQRLCDLM